MRRKSRACFKCAQPAADGRSRRQRCIDAMNYYQMVRRTADEESGLRRLCDRMIARYHLQLELIRSAEAAR